MSGWQKNQLIELAKQRYSDWDDFDHPLYVADEIDPKRKLVESASQSLSLDTLDALINAGDFDTIVGSIKQLTRQTNLLWRRVPTAGDTAVLEAPTLNPAQFSIQIRNLLYGDRPSAERLQTFSDYLEQENLPNKWPFPTFLLFVTQPETELIIKPQPAQWLLKFMGSNRKLPTTPTQFAYSHLQYLAQQLLEELKPLGAEDMIDVQSMIWIGMRESKKLVGALDSKSQIDLDVPPTLPLTAPMLKEKDDAQYDVSTDLYDVAQMQAETGYSTVEIQRWLNVVKRKGQLMFYGPPGTGKTFVAQKLGRLLIDQAPDKQGFCELVQFHPAYSYEDFMEGLRPYTTPTGDLAFEKKNGRFLQFCYKAQTHSGPCVLIIDEINRANLPSVLGELMFLLEYRNQQIRLAGGTPFSIPPNVKIIATMNSADRSLALVDFALRRRFAFIQLSPNFDLLHTHQTPSPINLPALIQLMHEINSQIADPHYAIGHTYFLQKELDKHLQDIWELEIIPYLNEYFFDSPQQISKYSWEKVSQTLLNIN